MIAFLRGVNVGGRHLLPMATLRELLEGLGLKNVKTLLQSGNAVFDAGRSKPEKLARLIEDAIEAAVGFRPAVILRTGDELRAVVDRSPFAGRDDVPGNRLLVTFFASEPQLVEMKALPEEVHFIGREMYVYFPDGVGQSKFPFAAVERKSGTPGTARNWNTVMKLREISASAL